MGDGVAELEGFGVEGGEGEGGEGGGEEVGGDGRCGGGHVLRCCVGGFGRGAGVEGSAIEVRGCCLVQS